MSALRNYIKYFPKDRVKSTLNKHLYHSNNEQLQLFDVTLRDGLQTQKTLYTVQEKYNIYKNIVKDHNPKSIEIGSIVSKNVLPQLANTIELFNFIQNQEFHNRKPKLYVLTPSIKSLKIAINNNIMNYSFITSVSEAFQLKNTRKSLFDTRLLINDMLSIVRDCNNNNNVKLYLSCIDECPISGKIILQHIIDEVMHYYVNHYNDINELCLSDTCGTLQYNRFKIIIDTLIKYYKIKCDKISLHLHVNESNMYQVSSIIHYAISKNINKFDVCYFKNMGGCSVTMEENKINGNLTYTNLYDMLRV